MAEVEIAWGDLKAALQNEEACDRYERGYRKEKEGKDLTGISQACKELQETIKKGMYYGTISNVCLI